jgi:hypothetical protein
MVSMILELARISVGLILVFAGGVKAIDSGGALKAAAPFAKGLVGRRSAALLVLAGAAFEVALGLALILDAWTTATIPVAAGLLLVLAALTLRADRVGELADCGCYGGVVLLTPGQSAVVDSGYVALLGVAWFGGHTSAEAHPLVAAAVAAGAALAVAAAWMSRRQPLYDLARLASGRRWRNRWLQGYDVGRGRHLVVFLGSTCAYCKKWVPFLNVLAAQNEAVLGVMRAGELDEFRQTFKVAFPIAPMRPLLFSRMVDSYPTVVLLEDGRVVGKWIGEMPQRYREQAHAVLAAVASASPDSTPKVFAG